MADRWIKNALGHEPGWEMGDKEIPPLEAAIVMREMPSLMRETLIAAGEATGNVMDLRKFFAGYARAD